MSTPWDGLLGGAPAHELLVRRRGVIHRLADDDQSIGVAEPVIARVATRTAKATKATTAWRGEMKPAMPALQTPKWTAQLSIAMAEKGKN